MVPKGSRKGERRIPLQDRGSRVRMASRQSGHLVRVERELRSYEACLPGSLPLGERVFHVENEEEEEGRKW